MTIDKDTVLIQHVLDAITAVDDFVKNISLSDFVESDLISSAVMKNLKSLVRQVIN